MQLRSMVLAASSAFVMPMTGQTMTLASGNLTIANGTSLSVSGPINWQLLGGAHVVNDGIIDLGATGTLYELDGAPVTGMGRELALWPATGPLIMAQPGNLGLSISTSYSAGDLSVERGHVPSLATSGAPSIGRWFRISTPVTSTEAMNVVIHYDLTELNGLLPADLSVFEAPMLVGTWTPLVTSGDAPAQTLSATDQAPWAYLTAFDFNAAMAEPEPSTVDEMLVWPTVVVDILHISSSAGDPIERFSVLDASGRCVMEKVLPSPGTFVQVNLSSLASGAYLIRVNGKNSGHRVIRP